MARVVLKVTLVANTPVQVSQLLNCNPTYTSGNYPGGAPCVIDRMFIQMQAGGTGLGEVYDGIPLGTIPVVGTTPGAQLAPATSTAPGGAYSDSAVPSAGNGIDGRMVWVASSQADPILISVDLKN